MNPNASSPPVDTADLTDPTIPQPQRVRHPVQLRPVHVVAIEDLSPHLRRLRLQGETVHSLVSAGFDDHVKLLLPTNGLPLNAEAFAAARANPAASDTPPPVMRDYTPLAVDPAAGTLDLMFSLHGSGPAARWAAQAQLGDQALIGGPRGSAVWPVDLAWQWLVGDESALPAISRRLQELHGTPTKITLVLDLLHPEEAVAALSPTLLDNPGLTCQVVPRPTQPSAHPSATERLAQVLDVVRHLPRPSGRGFAWIAAERTVARGVRSLLVDEWGLARAQVRAAAYWQEGQADHHERLED